MKELRRYRPPLEAGKVEAGVISFAVGVLHPLNEMRRRRGGERDISNHGRRVARLEGGDDRASVTLLLHQEMALPSGGVADQKKGQLAPLLLVEIADRHLLVGRNVEPRPL